MCNAFSVIEMYLKSITLTITFGNVIEFKKREKIRVVNDSKFSISRGRKRSVVIFKRLIDFYDILDFDFRLF